ncbi:family 16 glycoside hydrolase [Curtobacterium sp. RRHDQ10]|uniref:family 16 glycoside hydrolase n=1 Tax=Curtobacterium phyllosphaerae TaxID=3413379 RepID=UPI003BF4341D
MTRTLAAVVVAVLVVLGLTLPATQGAFVATVANGTNTLSTATNFTPGTLPFRSAFAGSDAGWTTYGGCWRTSVSSGFGIYSETCGGSGGQKAVTGSTSWTDYTLQADVKIDSGTQAGLLARVTSPSTGTDALTGYWVGITTSNTLVLGMMTNGTYTSLQTASVTSGISLNTWYHLVVQAVGCTFTVSQTTTGANTWTAFTYTDTGCTQTAGAIGVRDQDSTGSWRFITATAGGTTSTSVSPLNVAIRGGSFPNATPYGGTWTFDQAAETISDTTGGSGDKYVENTSWGDMTLTGDVRFDGAMDNRDVGYVVRVTNPARGTDALTGFYAGISKTGLVLGAQNNGYSGRVPTSLGRTVTVGEWWHLTVEVVGCKVTATASPAKGGPAVQNSYDYGSGCAQSSGSIGIRTLGAPASWRNIAVTPR